MVGSLPARVAALTRHRPADDADLADARRRLHDRHLAQYVAKVLDDAPALSRAQRDAIAGALFGAADRVRADATDATDAITRPGAA